MANCLPAAAILLALAVPAAPAESPADLQRQVREAETAFARTMAARDHGAFARFLADDAIFLAPDRALRGPREIAEGWKRFYEGPQAPFSWEPERVEVVDGGNLALSTGPVRDPKGERVGTFTSTWRREKDGRWRIVLDSGCPPCRCPSAAPTK